MGSLLKYTNYDLLTWDISSTASVTLSFGMINTNQGGSEALNRVQLSRKFIVKRIRVWVRVNTRAIGIPMALRINGASAVAWTIAAGTTGLQFDSGPINQAILAEDFVNNMFDLATAGAGSFSYAMMAEGVWIA